MPKKPDIKRLRQIGEKFFGNDYFQFLLAAGVACDVDPQELADELETTVANVVEMRDRYSDELAKVASHSKYTREIFDEISRVKLAQVAIELQDQLFRDLQAGEIETKDKISLFQFLMKTLGSKEALGGSQVKTPEDQKEFEERLARLAEGTKLRVVGGKGE